MKMDSATLKRSRVITRSCGLDVEDPDPPSINITDYPEKIRVSWALHGPAHDPLAWQCEVKPGIYPRESPLKNGPIVLQGGPWKIDSLMAQASAKYTVTGYPLLSEEMRLIIVPHMHGNWSMHIRIDFVLRDARLIVHYIEADICRFHEFINQDVESYETVVHYQSV